MLLQPLPLKIGKPPFSAKLPMCCLKIVSESGTHTRQAIYVAMSIFLPLLLYGITSRYYARSSGKGEMSSAL